MKFPIESNIEPADFGPLGVGARLKIEGNSGMIPVSFQCFILDEEDRPLMGKVVQFTTDQWNQWTTQPDELYILSCCATLMKVTIQA